jgi:glutamine cyclotransferase
MMADFWGYPRDARCGVGRGRLPVVSVVVKRLRMKAERMAENIAAENLWSGGLDNLRITMWVVTWEQIPS